MGESVTKDDLLTLRRAVRALRFGGLRTEGEAESLARRLDAMADDNDAPNLCEGCNAEGIYADDEGCYACQKCADDVRVACDVGACAMGGEVE